MAVDADNLVASLDHVVLLGHLHDHLDHVVAALVRVDLVAPDTAGDLKLLDDLLVHGASKDWHWGLVLGYKAGQAASVGDNDNQVDV